MPATLLFADREIGWTAFDDAAQRAAGGFERLGVADGDVVCIMLRNEPAFLEAVFAARRLGAYPCPINWHYKADEAGPFPSRRFPSRCPKPEKRRLQHGLFTVARVLPRLR